MPRAVLDTNVLVSALIRPDGTCARLLTEMRAGAFELVASPMLLDELRDALGRDKFRRDVSIEEVDVFLATLRAEAIVRPDPAPSSPPEVRDPDDQYLVDLARAVRVDALVTGDAALLELRDRIPVMTPAEFMATLAGL